MLIQCPLFLKLRCLQAESNNQRLLRITHLEDLVLENSDGYFRCSDLGVLILAGGRDRVTKSRANKGAHTAVQIPGGLCPLPTGKMYPDTASQERKKKREE